MKKRIVSFVGILLTVMLLFSSCGSDALTVADLLVDPADSTPLYTQAKELPVQINEDSGNHLAVYYKTDEASVKTVTVWDVFLDREIGSYSTFPHRRIYAKIYTVQGWDYYTVFEDAYYKTTLYDPYGKKIAEASGQLTVTVRFDLLEFDGVCYRIREKDGKVAKKPEFPFGSIACIDAATEDYYYAIQKLGRTVTTIYDRNLQYVTTHVVQNNGSDGLEHDPYVLRDGRLLVQYRYKSEETDTAAVRSNETSTYFFRLQSLIFDPKSGKETEVQLPFYVVKMKQASETDPVPSALRDHGNAAQVRMIENGVLKETEWVILSDSLEVSCYLSRMSEGQMGLPTRMNFDHFVIQTAESERLLLDREGQVIPVSQKFVNFNQYYLIGEQTIWDLQQNAVLAYQAEGYQIKRVLPQSILLSKQGRLWVLGAQGLQKIENGQSTVVESDTLLGVSCYSKQTGNLYRYYNAAGQCILETKENLQRDQREFCCPRTGKRAVAWSAFDGNGCFEVTYLFSE